jgi:hypothetical protein
MVFLILVLSLVVCPSVARAQPVNIEDYLSLPARINDKTLDSNYECQLNQQWAERRAFIQEAEKYKILPAFELLGYTLLNAHTAVMGKDYKSAHDQIAKAIRTIPLYGDDYVHRGYIGFLIHIDSALSYMEGAIRESISKEYCANTLIRYSTFNKTSDFEPIMPSVQQFIDGWPKQEVLKRWVFYNYRIYLPDVSRPPDVAASQLYEPIADFQQDVSRLILDGQQPDRGRYKIRFETYIINCVDLDNFLIVESDPSDGEVVRITKDAIRKFIPQAQYREGKINQVIAILDQKKANEIIKEYYLNEP